MPGRRTEDTALVTTVPLPPPPSSFAEWIKSANGILAIAALLMTSSFGLAVSIYAQKVDAADNKTYNAQTYQTKEDARQSQEELKDLIKAAADDAKSAASAAQAARENTAVIMGALGIKPLR